MIIRGTIKILEPLTDSGQRLEVTVTVKNKKVQNNYKKVINKENTEKNLVDFKRGWILIVEQLN